MARVQVQTVSKGHEVIKRRRPGVHSKCRTSKSKNSKHYVKPYRGQGR